MKRVKQKERANIARGVREKAVKTQQESSESIFEKLRTLVL